MRRPSAPRGARCGARSPGSSASSASWWPAPTRGSTAPPAGLRQAGPRLLELGELERTRDALVERVAELRANAAEQAAGQARARERRAAMLLAPGRHKWARVTQADVGEPGCGAWESRPRLGLIGMLMGWWQVKLSSGCPLAA